MFAAFHIPDLPAIAALQQQPEWQDRPCGILRDPTDKEDGKIPLLSINPAAWQTGIAPGWPLGRALVRCPDLKVLPRQPAEEAALLMELLEFADSLTPDVEITSGDTILLDLSTAPASTIHDLVASVYDRRLPTSPRDRRTKFQEQKFQRRSPTDATCMWEISLAGTPDLAHFAVLEPRTRGRFVSIQEIGTLPLPLLEKLEGNGSFLPLLELLGLRTLADYGQLPRQDLAERFGPSAAHWHEVISGKTCRLLKLHRPPESLAQSIDFDDAIHSSEALVFVFNRLLHVLSSRLAARHLAASILEIHLRLEEGGMRREIHLPEPLSEPAALLKPIQTFAESLVLPAPVVGIDLDATAALPLSRQRDWTQRQLPDPGRWADTLARLEALVGSGRVGIPIPLESDRPDAFEMRNAVSPDSASTLPPFCSIPLRRFRPPLKIAVASVPVPGKHPRPLALLTGPYPGEVTGQRGPFLTSGDHWNPDAAWQRLEWDVRLDRAPLLRLVFLSDNRWQLDGIYD